MKTPAELAECRLDSPDSHKKRAAVLRRLSGGLRGETTRADATGLSPDDVRTLMGAVSVLDKLATAYAKAGKLAQQRRDAEDRMEKAVRAAMIKDFSQLTSVADRVALIAAVKSYVLRNSAAVWSLRDLDYWFRDALDSLAYSLAGQAGGLEAEVLVSEAWAKFSAGRGELEIKYKALIEKLMVRPDGTLVDPVRQS